MNTRIKLASEVQVGDILFFAAPIGPLRVLRSYSQAGRRTLVLDRIRGGQLDEWVVADAAWVNVVAEAGK